ncbi:MAG: hypothetical protein K0R80_1818 [Clostridia bacterium]|nr:hypothetical protein [Clostridia bacterium]
MRYTVSPEVFELSPELKFGILIGKGLQNTPSSLEDTARLRKRPVSILINIPYL